MPSHKRVKFSIDLPIKAHASLKEHAELNGMSVEDQAAMFVLQGLWVEDGFDRATMRHPMILLLPIFALSHLKDIARIQRRDFSQMLEEAFRVGYESIVEPYLPHEIGEPAVGLIAEADAR